ncbi:MAG: acyl carrier protein [Aeriscardovia sp.]|nr:acyl carrier protein [Aeriscardovia sp.]MBR3461967.1 acyl carrier protein [Clostridiales bacterium]MCR4767885.1 hypothetical protein [Saccharofermentans sp.]
MEMIPELYSIICDTYKTMNRTFDVPLDSITVDSDLKEIGIDSLSFVVILMNIESRMNISLPMDGNFTLKTVGDVINMIESSK